MTETARDADVDISVENDAIVRRVQGSELTLERRTEGSLKATLPLPRMNQASRGKTRQTR